MGSSEIWDKYHECCIGNGDKFHEAKFGINTTRVVLEIYHFQYNTRGIYFTATHAITSTNHIVM